MENRSIRLDVPDRDWVRSVPVKAMFRPPEADDLDTIAEGWGVPVATAVWAIVVEQLARWRRQAPDLGPRLGDRRRHDGSTDATRQPLYGRPRATRAIPEH